MLGILLLLIALVCYFSPRRRWLSYFLYVSFMIGYNGGFGLWIDRITGIKNNDLAVIYTFLISLHLLAKGRYKFPKLSFIKQYKWLIGFLGCSVVFSYVHYGFGVYDILQGSRTYLLFFSLPILCRITHEEFDKLMRVLLLVTTITAILYILQIVVGRPLMPYGDGTADSYSLDESTGLVRLYNSPALHVFFLAASFVCPQYFGKKVNFYRVLFFASLMCTLGRTGIFTGILTVGLAMFFNGKTGKLIKTALILGIMFLPFADMIGNRFEKGETDDDIQTVLRGGAATYENSSDGGTMTYRIAWVLERAMYLADRPLGEQIFGLGLITDSYPHMPYHFSLGLYNKETGTVAQMGTPDIAYGNLVTWWGFGGTIVYMVLVVSLVVYFYKHRHDNHFATVCAASSLMEILGSFSGATISTPVHSSSISSSSPPSCVQKRTPQTKLNTRNEDSTHRIWIGQPDA